MVSTTLPPEKDCTLVYLTYCLPTAFLTIVVLSFFGYVSYLERKMYADRKKEQSEKKETTTTTDVGATENQQ